jgi:nitroreductase/Pyruvate/2-oxoacid:ferredoxin oxidoreductase delta subunit
MDLQIDENLCSRCGLCEKVCLLTCNFGFASISDAPEESCIRCGHCASVCPRGAILHPELRGVQDWPKASIDSERMLSMIKANRTVRNFAKREIPVNVWETLAEAARYSSTGMNFQEIRALFVTDRELIGNIGRAVRKTLSLYKILYRFPLTRWMIGAISSPLSMQYLKTNSYRPETGVDDPDTTLYDAPGLILLAGPKNLECARDDANIMAANLNLIAASSGLGCCYIGGIPQGYHLGNRELRSLIPLPRGYTVFQAVILGYPAVNKRSLPPRKEVHRFLPEITA